LSKIIKKQKSLSTNSGAISLLSPGNFGVGGALLGTARRQSAWPGSHFRPQFQSYYKFPRVFLGFGGPQNRYLVFLGFCNVGFDKPALKTLIYWKTKTLV
jgi:hypothetical protein